MSDIAGMRERAQYLRDQAASLREMGRKSLNDREMAERFEQLARECQQIADNIEINIPLHERAAEANN